MSALNLLTIRQLFNRRRYDSVCRLITSLETAKQEQRDSEKCLAEVKAQAELLTAEKEEMLAKWNEEKDKSSSLIAELRLKVDSLSSTIETQKNDAKAMEVELAKVKFDKEAFEEDAETRMVRRNRRWYIV